MEISISRINRVFVERHRPGPKDNREENIMKISELYLLVFQYLEKTGHKPTEIKPELKKYDLPDKWRAELNASGSELNMGTNRYSPGELRLFIGDMPGALLNHNGGACLGGSEDELIEIVKGWIEDAI